jgi:hypothetical protein
MRIFWKIRFWLLSFVFGLMVISCKKKENDLPHEPVLEFTEATPLIVQQFRDSIMIRFKYADSQGDLGDESPDVFSLHVKDDRLNAPDVYHVSPLAPLENKIKIEGELKLKLNGMFLIGKGKTETTILRIKIMDREGNWSNEILTPMITIKDSL